MKGLNPDSLESRSVERYVRLKSARSCKRQESQTHCPIPKSEIISDSHLNDREYLVNFLPPQSTDFIQYWTAFYLAGRGLDPYDPELMFMIQQSLGLIGGVPTMMWNPPWLLLLLSPFLLFDLMTSLTVWRYSTAVLSFAVFISILAALKVKLSRGSVFAVFLLLATSLSLWHGLRTGQIHGVLLIALGLAIIGKANSKSWVTAASLVLMSLKPHIFYLLGLRIIFETLRSRDLTILRRAGILLSSVILATELLWPGVVSNWIATILFRVEGRHVPVEAWAVSTLVYPIRLLAGSMTGMLPVAPMVLVPGITGIVCLAYWMRNGSLRNSYTFFPYLMVLSYLTSPYGWLSDQLVLLPAVFVALYRAAEINRALAAILAIVWLGLQLMGLALLGTVFKAEHHYIWLPLCVATLIGVVEYQRWRISPGN